ncbi:MAG: signal recognition particle-docking protein FtsY, partial [Actinomycetes bacterium]
MSAQNLWIVIAIVVAVLLVAIAVGLVLRSRRRISLRDAAKAEEIAPQRKGGTYQAERGFDFSSGTATETE